MDSYFGLGFFFKFYIANLLYRFVGACDLANQINRIAFTKRADPSKIFLMSRTATFFFVSHLICRLLRLPKPEEGNILCVSLLDIMPAADNQQAER